MNLQIGLICLGLILGGTLILTLILELIKQDGIYNGSILTSMITSYKSNIMHILIAFLWIGGIIVAIELILTFYDGARMRYRLRIEFFERLEDFYYRQLPQLTLVYTKPPEPVEPPVQLPPPIQQPPALHIEQVELPPRRIHTRRRSNY